MKMGISHLTDFNGDKVLSLGLDGSKNNQNCFKDVTCFSNGLVGYQLGQTQKASLLGSSCNRNLDPIQNLYDSLLLFPKG